MNTGDKNAGGKEGKRNVEKETRKEGWQEDITTGRQKGKKVRKISRLGEKYGMRILIENLRI